MKKMKRGIENVFFSVFNFEFWSYNKGRVTIRSFIGFLQNEVEKLLEESEDFHYLSRLDEWEFNFTYYDPKNLIVVDIVEGDLLVSFYKDIKGFLKGIKRYKISKKTYEKVKEEVKKYRGDMHE